MSVFLQIMICTYGSDGLQRVEAMTLPRVDGVEYLVSCQSDPAPIPEKLCRDDVRVIFSDTKGLSNNRNNALDNSNGVYSMIADDDLEYYANGIETFISILKNNPDIDFATFIVDVPFDKTYPRHMHDLSKPCRFYYVMSVEMAFRTSWLRDHNLRFSPLLGIGAPYLSSGEESVLAFNMIRKGACARFLDIRIARHPELPTLHRQVLPPSALRADGAYIVLVYPFTAVARLILKAKRANGAFARNLLYLCQGAVYALKNRKMILEP